MTNKFMLPALPFDEDALEPHMSKKTINVHYWKHHQGYINKLNEAIAGTKYESMSLEEIVRNSSGKVFNNAAQAWNHAFFWECLRTPGKVQPADRVAELLIKNFSSFESFKKEFSKNAAELFGSGWVWLVTTKENPEELAIESCGNAATPIVQNKIPLLTLDVWEHAYYLDYQYARPKFIENFWEVVNWEFAEQQLSKPYQFPDAKAKEAQKKPASEIRLSGPL